MQSGLEAAVVVGRLDLSDVLAVQDGLLLLCRVLTDVSAKIAFKSDKKWCLLNLGPGYVQETIDLSRRLEISQR